MYNTIALSCVRWWRRHNVAFRSSAFCRLNFAAKRNNNMTSNLQPLAISPHYFVSIIHSSFSRSCVLAYA